MMGSKILAVDDNKEYLTLVEMLLKRAGFEVTLAENAMTAMASLEKEQPDAILLDIMMPTRTGIEFLENLRWDSRYERIPVIVLTAMTLNKEEQDFVDAFATLYLDKAQTPDLVQRLQEVLPES